MRGDVMQFDPATVIFAFLALFVLWKLRSVLGERTGLEQKPNEGRVAFPAPVSPPPSSANDDARWTDFAERGGAVWNGLDAISSAQPGFAPRAFLDGASSAYEMVVQAFSRGDEGTLQSLTSEDVFASFKSALTERSRRGETLETTFVGFNSVKIVEARMERKTAQIAVRFDSQFVTATRDKAGDVVEGDPNKPSNIIDVWTFARRSDASGPNWILVATTPAQ
jgi:predicted lipid-binding transport protein (Tim44 family)